MTSRKGGDASVPSGAGAFRHPSNFSFRRRPAADIVVPAWQGGMTGGMFNWSNGWLEAELFQAVHWLDKTLLDWALAWQVAATLAALLAARLVVPPARRLVAGVVSRQPWASVGGMKTVWRTVHLLALPALWLAGQWVATALLAAAHRPGRLTETVAALLTAWLVIRVSTAFIADRGWSRLVAVIAWSVAALDIIGLLDPTIRLLDRIGMDFGTTRLSLLLLIKACIALGVLLWLSGALSRLLEKRIHSLSELTPSAQVLLTKLGKVTLVTLGVVVALKSVGIDLSGIALLSGAVGLGVGFGLQKVVSNLVSGVILLLDKSVKPGDVISLDETYGWIASMGARYVSVITRDGIEYLIPNEDLITQRVQNWSFTNERVRLRVPVGVAYSTDLKRAMALCVEAARAAPRVLAEPPPICLMVGFGASSLDLELRCWICDPKNGVTAAKSAVLMGIWERFRANGIEVPFPQTDVHVRTLPAAPGPAAP